MATIQNSIQQIADSFVQQVLQALTTASLSELSELAGGSRRGGGAAAAGAVSGRRGPGRPRGSSTRAGAGGSSGAGRGRVARAEAPSARGGRGRGGRRNRRSSEDVHDMAERAADFVRSNQGDGGLAVSEIARGLGMGTAEITRPIAIALLDGKIYKQGEKRLTRYFSGSGGGEKRGRRSKK